MAILAWPLTSIICGTHIKECLLSNWWKTFHKKQKWWQREEKHATMVIWPWPSTLVLTGIMWGSIRNVWTKFGRNPLIIHPFRGESLKITFYKLLWPVFESIYPISLTDLYAVPSYMGVCAKKKEYVYEPNMRSSGYKESTGGFTEFIVNRGNFCFIYIVVQCNTVTKINKIYWDFTCKICFEKSLPSHLLVI